MGCICSSDTTFERSQWIDQMIKQEAERKNNKKELEILIIGTKYSGKSTLLKHIRTMFGVEDGSDVHNESDFNSTVKAQFSFSDIQFKVISWTGEMPRNRRLLHYFESVMAIIFIVDISIYDQFNDNDPPKNILTESMELYGTVCNNKYFEDKCLILFFSKTDTFEEKIRTIALNSYFPEYCGTKNCGKNELLTHIRTMFGVEYGSYVFDETDFNR
ncbi:guanine nucleotide-binding protein G(o) subunit alpha-like isoform X2 [Mercenaria mercenaria]|uniref:guanine nucleotide-binding protein G(o) subunit alpha-like isoform X2 n=1 Tax=Mercenaria mercenaria TaxID=6596 RepID=UPI00234F1A4D|nr:guanine nucleotide-binding protein G(o) subunit alpha-like isoform X2 [Mercenaria mercenaria]